MTPFESYYRTARGSWRGHFALQLNKPLALFWSPLPLHFKVQIVLLNWIQPVLGRFEMQTQVTMPHPHEVHHKFWLKKWGVTLYASEESFSSDAEGKEFTLQLADAFWPFLAHKHHQAPQTGQIFNATKALYLMPFLGGVYPMHTELHPESFKMVLETPWGQGAGQMTPIESFQGR